MRHALPLSGFSVPSAELENTLTARRAKPVKQQKGQVRSSLWCSSITVSTIYKQCGFQPQFNILTLNKSCAFLSVPVDLTRSRSPLCPQSGFEKQESNLDEDAWLLIWQLSENEWLWQFRFTVKQFMALTMYCLEKLLYLKGLLQSYIKTYWY